MKIRRFTHLFMFYPNVIAYLKLQNNSNFDRIGFWDHIQKPTAYSVKLKKLFPIRL